MHFDQCTLVDLAVVWTLASFFAVLILTPWLWANMELCIQWLCTYKNIATNHSCHLIWASCFIMGYTPSILLYELFINSLLTSSRYRKYLFHRKLQCGFAFCYTKTLIWRTKMVLHQHLLGICNAKSERLTLTVTFWKVSIATQCFG